MLVNKLNMAFNLNGLARLKCLHWCIFQYWNNWIVPRVKIKLVVQVITFIETSFRKTKTSTCVFFWEKFLSHQSYRRCFGKQKTKNKKGTRFLWNTCYEKLTPRLLQYFSRTLWIYFLVSIRYSVSPLQPDYIQICNNE